MIIFLMKEGIVNGAQGNAHPLQTHKGIYMRLRHKDSKGSTGRDQPSLQFDRLTQKIVRKIQLKIVQTENWLQYYIADISSRC